MIRNTLLAVACTIGYLASAQMAHAADAPQRAPAEAGSQTFKSSTLSSEAYVPQTTLEGTPLPNCQVKIGDTWSDTPAASLEACADLLDQKTPANPESMTTAYWSGLFLSADGKNIYKAAKEATEWTVLRPRGQH